MMLRWGSEVENVLAASSETVLLTSGNEGTPLGVIQAGIAGPQAIAGRVD